MRRSVALLVLAACSSKSLAPDASDGAGAPEGGAPDTPVMETGAETSPSDVPADRIEAPFDVPADRTEALSDVPADRTEALSDGGLCLQTNDHATVSLRLPGGAQRSCASASSDGGPQETWVGKVSASDTTSITVDVCDGDAGCVPSPLVIQVSAPGLDLSRFPRVPVRVRAEFRSFFQCQVSLEITTADAPDGGASPDGGTSSGGHLLLAVVDGGTTFAGSPYAVGHTRLDCAVADAATGQAGKYAFDFSSASAPVPFRVHMGETATWLTDGTPMTVRNLRSYETGNFDDYWNWAYTIYIDPKP